MPFLRLQSVLGLLLALISTLEAAQIPTFVSQQNPEVPQAFSLENDPEIWDINVAPNENNTGHLVFETVNSFLQHWPNTRYRNGK